MPIGAALGGAALAAGGSVAAGAIGSSAQKKAAQTAADTSLATTNANNALFRETRGQNIQIAAPFYNNGVAAGNALQELLLGPQSTSGNTNAGAVGALGGAGGYGGGALDAYLAANPDVANDYNTNPGISHEMFPTPESYAAWHYQHYGQSEGRAAPAVNVPAPAASSGAAPGGSALDAFDRFRQGTNYQFRYNQGLNANRGAFATKGALDSGAAIKSAQTYGENIASSELSNYMNLLAGQQNVGLSAGNAIMGVSTSAANAIAGQNTNAGNVAANAALTAGQANANLWGTVGNTAGQIGGALFQYGMGRTNPAMSIASYNPNYSYAVSPELSNPQPVSSVPVNWNGF